MTTLRAARCCSPPGAEEDQADLYELAADAGYTVAKTQAEAEALTAGAGPAVVISEQLADGDSIPYELDREEGTWALSDYVAQGIELLNNDTGFFMMVEGGKIDWACHANDAGSTLGDTKALSDAVEEAIAFYNEHPDETLILVTGDHETGGLTIGYAGTNYDTSLQNLATRRSATPSTTPTMSPSTKRKAPPLSRCSSMCRNCSA